MGTGAVAFNQGEVAGNRRLDTPDQGVPHIITRAALDAARRPGPRGLRGGRWVLERLGLHQSRQDLLWCMFWMNANSYHSVNPGHGQAGHFLQRCSTTAAEHGV